MPEGRETGIVKNFHAGKGYGFIRRQSGKDIFVHIRDVEKAGLGVLNEGDYVSFNIAKTPKGLQAVDLAMAKDVDESALQFVTQRSGPDTSTDFRFGPEYLKDGYFEPKDGNEYLRAEALDSLAMEIAKLLGSQGMKTHQIRRFFNKARGIESRLERDKDFEAIKEHIFSLKRDVAYQVGRKVVPEEFQEFINRNMGWAVKDETSFRRGFMNHFESVLAYFVYYFRE